MAEKKKTNPRAKPEKVIQVGQVYAQVRQGVSNAGFTYRYYELGRQWQTATGKQQTGTSFFATHRDDLADCVMQASAYIAEADHEALATN